VNWTFHQNPELGAFWKAKGLSTRAVNVLLNAELNCEADVQKLGPAALMRLPNSGKATVRELGQVLFGKEWTPPFPPCFGQHITDAQLIAELEERGYTVTKRSPQNATVPDSFKSNPAPAGER